MSTRIQGCKVDGGGQRYHMEVEKLSWVKIFLLVGVHLAFLADIGFCKPSSVSSEGLNFNSNSLLKTRSTSKKYVSESYFEKHDSLLDFSFDSYIANELPIVMCGTVQDNLDAKLSVHKRLLVGEGSHRKLHSTIKLDIRSDLIAEKFNHLWKFVIVERLPSGVFADPFELQHLLDRGVFSDATVLGDTNLELPSIASNRSLVEVHIDINHGMSSGLDNVLTIDIELPLHARYPPFGASGFSRVIFGRPDLFVLCNIEEKSNRICLIAHDSDTESQAIVWEVPCGIKEHCRVVSVVTFVSAVVSTFFIVLTTLCYPGNCKF